MEENKVVNDTASFDGDVGPILPDGWKEGDDIFADGEGENEETLAKLFADGQEAEQPLDPENDDANPDPAAPTTGEPGEGNVTDAEDHDPSAAPDGAAGTETRAPRKLMLKVNHEEQEVDIDAMSDDELRALLQKGKAFDAMKDAENKRTYRQVYQEQIDAGMTEAAARMVAKDAAEGHAYALTDEEEQKAPEAAAQEPTPESTPSTRRTRDLRAEVEQLRALYPEITEMPDEVAKAVSQGIPVLTAYLAYREKQSTQAAANLRKENQILRQNAANSAKAPVRGVTGGDNAPPKKKSIFEEGFDAGMRWN